MLCSTVGRVHPLATNRTQYIDDDSNADVILYLIIAAVLLRLLPILGLIRCAAAFILHRLLVYGRQKLLLPGFLICGRRLLYGEYAVVEELGEYVVLQYSLTLTPVVPGSGVLSRLMNIQAR